MSKYLDLRGRVFWFKRRAPVPLKAKDLLVLDSVATAVGKNGYVRFSLGTSNPKDAAKLARKYAHLLDEEAAKRQRPQPNPAQVSDPLHSSEEIQMAADTMYATLLAADELNRPGSCRHSEALNLGQRRSHEQQTLHGRIQA